MRRLGVFSWLSGGIPTSFLHPPSQPDALGRGGIPGRSRPGVGTEEQSDWGSRKESQPPFGLGPEPPAPPCPSRTLPHRDKAGPGPACGNKLGVKLRARRSSDPYRALTALPRPARSHPKPAKSRAKNLPAEPERCGMAQGGWRDGGSTRRWGWEMMGIGMGNNGDGDGK